MEKMMYPVMMNLSGKKKAQMMAMNMFAIV